MRKPGLIGLLLLLGLLAGLAFQPDDGTAVQRPDAEAHSVVAGANHAKPLPRIATPGDLVPTLALTVGALALAVAAGVTVTGAGFDRGRWHPASRRLASALTQRGPPASA